MYLCVTTYIITLLLEAQKTIAWMMSYIEIDRKLRTSSKCSSHYFNCTSFQAVIRQRYRLQARWVVFQWTLLLFRRLLKVVKRRPWVTKIVITLLKQKGFSKACCYFWSLYDLTSAGSITFKGERRWGKPGECPWMKPCTWMYGEISILMLC